MIESLFIDDFQILPHDDSSKAGLVSIDGLGTPAPRQEIIGRSRSHGATDHTLYYSGRVISLVGYVYGPSMELANTRLDELKSKLHLGINRTLKFRRIGQADDEYLIVRAASALEAPMDGAAQIIKWSVDLHAPDPRIYGLATRTGSYDPTSAGGSGFNLPVVFPIVFEGTSSAYLLLTNQGNFPTPPIFTIQGPIVNPIIDNDTTGLSFHTSGLTLSAGDAVVVDMAKKTLAVGGVNRMDYINAALTSWFDLTPGSNSIRLRGQGTVTGQTSLSVTFHDARI